MQWITSEEKMKKIVDAAYGCVDTDSGRLPTSLIRLVFDELGVETAEFAKLVFFLMSLSGENAASFVVLRHDPIYYYHRIFGRYPAFTLECGDSAAIYIDALNEKLNSDKIDTIGTFWYECVFASSSQAWFAHAVRVFGDVNGGGHLWIPAEWVEQVLQYYPSLTAPSPTT